MAEKPPVILTIAGFDPSSGAGVTADIKTIAAHSCYGVACITALTVQSTSGVKEPEEMKAAATRLHEMGAQAVVITGGDLEKAIDLLSFPSKGGFEQEIFKAERQRSNSTHGTGCAFATAMACHLAQDRGLAEATLLAKTYVTAAITNGQPLGRGVGPVHHLYRMTQQRRAAGTGGESN